MDNLNDVNLDGLNLWFGDYKRSQRKKQKSLREAKKRTRSIDVSRLSESDNKAWKGVFNG